MPMIIAKIIIIKKIKILMSLNIESFKKRKILLTEHEAKVRVMELSNLEKERELKLH